MTAACFCGHHRLTGDDCDGYHYGASFQSATRSESTSTGRQLLSFALPLIASLRIARAWREIASLRGQGAATGYMGAALASREGSAEVAQAGPAGLPRYHRYRRERRKRRLSDDEAFRFWSERGQFRPCAPLTLRQNCRRASPTASSIRRQAVDSSERCTQTGRSPAL